MPLLIEDVTEHNQAFVFHFLPETKFQSFGSKDVQPLLDKWGFGPDMVMCTFRIEQQVQQDEMQMMLDAFFRDKEVMGVLQHLTGMRMFSPDKVSVHWEKLSTKTTSMSFFNRFEECGAIGKAGHIRGRMEEDWEGVPIVNLVREAILVEESELYDAFSGQDRREFLFCIFSHLVFGGASNQWEDHVEEYFKVTKAVYKDLLSVRRNDAGDVEVMSTVASIRSLGTGGSLFPKESPLNFCYVILDPLMRHLRVWYFGYRPIW
mmetsp:Transcript_57605/g.134116  ORF Transcript_57605/g.134116 Transcript_57605/m.134116 type:complete len:262 (+) Transcript_57605:36-821(+)|eukprot:CAMPEP_0171090596 /NCGR_PEP_ID=MMETSP0766_2-20121228/31956_1 /TAXON_ID=439317 /ORGANISM="Gambierdiscus australes, Strain CAWD 149" /LENGTH=261 /DNA_ID=CAMNT_0011548609 /DNA_START=30 /DNA_END=815 /DNA_ORIENTATION=+